MTLHRYWLTFDRATQIPTGFLMGCGITATSESDALELLASIYPDRPGCFSVSDIKSDITIGSLEKRHVLPNIGDTSKRGVWFPNFALVENGFDT